MTTFSDFKALRASGYAPKARFVPVTGEDKLDAWIHKTLEGKEGE